MNTVIVKKVEHASPCNYAWISSMCLIASCLILACLVMLGSMIVENDMQTKNLSAQYHTLQKKSYMTTTESKKLFNKATKYDTDGSEEIIKDLDGKTVVDNANGHEYVVHTILKRNLNDHSSYYLTPKLKGNSVVINQAWLKKHKK